MDIDDDQQQEYEQGFEQFNNAIQRPETREGVRRSHKNDPASHQHQLPNAPDADYQRDYEKEGSNNDHYVFEGEGQPRPDPNQQGERPISMRNTRQSRTANIAGGHSKQHLEGMNKTLPKQFPFRKPGGTQPKVQGGHSNSPGQAGQAGGNFPMLNNFQVDYDVTRMRPRIIPLDKERLYDESLKLKIMVNNLREENLKLKTKMQNLERENIKFEKMIEFHQTRPTGRDIPSKSQPHRNEHHLLFNLKKQMKEMKGELEDKIDECERLKRTTKYSRIQEIEAELKAYADETIRLKFLLDQTTRNQMIQATQLLNTGSQGNVSNFEERLGMQNNMINTLRMDNSEMAKAIKYLEEQLDNLKTSLDESEKVRGRQNKELTILRKQVKDKEAELGKIKNENAQNVGTKKVQDERRSVELQSVANQAQEKDTKIKDLERRNDGMTRDYNELKDTFARLQRENDQLSNQAEREKRSYQQEKAKWLEEKGRLEDKLTEKQDKNRNDQDDRVKSQLKEKDAELKNLQSEIQNLRGEVQLLQKANAKLEGEGREKAQLATKLTKEIEELRHAQTELQHHVQHTSQQRETTQQLRIEKQPTNKSTKVGRHNSNMDENAKEISFDGKQERTPKVQPEKAKTPKKTEESVSKQPSKGKDTPKYSPKPGVDEEERPQNELESSMGIYEDNEEGYDEEEEEGMNRVQEEGEYEEEPSAQFNPPPKNEKKSGKSNKTQQSQKVPPVGQDEIAEVCEDLKWRLLSQKIGLEELEDFLFDEQNQQTGKVSIEELIYAFECEPFGISGEKNRLLLARYLVEDGEVGQISFSKDAKNDIRIVLSIFRRLLGNYKVPTVEEDHILFDQAVKLVSKNPEAISNMLAAKDVNNTQTLPRKEIEAVFAALDLTLPPKVADFLFLSLYDTHNPRSKGFRYQEIVNRFYVPSQPKEEKKAKKKKTQPVEADPEEQELFVEERRSGDVALPKHSKHNSEEPKLNLGKQNTQQEDAKSKASKKSVREPPVDDFQENKSQKSVGQQKTKQSLLLDEKSPARSQQSELRSSNGGQPQKKTSKLEETPISNVKPDVKRKESDQDFEFNEEVEHNEPKQKEVRPQSQQKSERKPSIRSEKEQQYDEEFENKPQDNDFEPPEEEEEEKVAANKKPARKTPEPQQRAVSPEKREEAEPRGRSSHQINPAGPSPLIEEATNQTLDTNKTGPVDEEEEGEERKEEAGNKEREGRGHKNTKADKRKASGVNEEIVEEEEEQYLQEDHKEKDEKPEEDRYADEQLIEEENIVEQPPEEKQRKVSLSVGEEYDNFEVDEDVQI